MLAPRSLLRCGRNLPAHLPVVLLVSACVVACRAGTAPEASSPTVQAVVHSGDQTDRTIARIVTAAQAVKSRPQPAQLADARGANGQPDQHGGDSFAEDCRRIRQLVPAWDEGTGATLRFLQESTGKRVSLIFVDATAPLYKPEASLWMIQATAKDYAGKTIGHLVLLLRSLKPGHMHGDEQTQDAVLGVLVGSERWDGHNPETSWSINSGSYCDVVLRDAGGGNLEGEIRGKLVDNRGSGFINVESGYFYINR